MVGMGCEVEEMLVFGCLGNTGESELIGQEM